MKKIEITFTETGDTQVKTTGFFGRACLKASEFIEKALGIARSKSLTSDAYKQDVKPEQDINR